MPLRAPAVLALLVAGCFNPDLGSKPFLCGTVDPVCPSGYSCISGLCVSGHAIDGGAKADGRRLADGAVQVCEPNSVSCVGNVAHKCRSDGSGEDVTSCNLASSEICFPDAGCAALCSNSGNARGEGCDFLPTPVGGAEDATGFAIVIVNGGDAPAHVRIDGGKLDAARFRTVAPHDQLLEKLPWIDALATCAGATCSIFAGGSTQAVGAAYRVVSTLPVSVIQYNPYGPSASGDASRLLPQRSSGKSYVTVSAPPAAGWPTFLAVSAWGTASVTVKPRVTTLAGNGVPVILGAGSRTFNMARGDVVVLYSLDDLTGSEVSADKAVQVISGTTCASFSDASDSCSHVEEALLPGASLFYQALAPRIPGLVYDLRVVAAEGAGTLTISDGTNPAQTRTLAGKGSFTDIVVGEMFSPSVLVGTMEKNAIIVSQTVVGAPAMSIYRPLVDKSTAVTSPGWINRAAAVIAKQGDAVTLDGHALLGSITPTPIAASGYVQWIVPIGDGAHVIATPSESSVTVLAADDTNGVATFWY